ncbi:MAG TPA: hypothetical protein VNJ09_01960 [Chthonomonadales bacterium]|nr:hypothetical protein [Chthonomonadales bacterium]
MAYRRMPLLAIVGLCLAMAASLGQSGKQQQSDKGRKGAKQSSTQVQKAAVTVNDLAVKPDAHLGKIAVVGVVATVNEKKGFVLIDSREYKECGLSCLTEPGTKKVLVRWTGAAPKVKDSVRVEGTMEKGPKGYTFTAQKVGKG